MNLDQIKKRMKELKDQGRRKLERQRFCLKSDVEGLRKIIRDNNKITCIEVISRNPSWLDFKGCDEYFYSTDDEGFNKFAREQILNI